MYKNLPFLPFLISILFFSCSKDNKQPTPQNNNSNAIQIALISGGGQTDTIGRQLTTSVTVKVSQNGKPVSGYNVLFQGSGCNADLTHTFTTATDGTAGIYWSLAGDVGPQTMKAIVLNSQNQKIDSVTATATGLAPGTGWHFSACTPFAYQANSFCKLSTGRLFTSIITGKTSLRYSDDNGMSWNAVKSLGNSHVFQYVISTPADEIFAFTEGEGTFYSSDAGQTWTTLSAQPFNNDNISVATYTPTGKLMVTSQSHALSISLDKGKTWTTPALNLFTPLNSTSPDESFNDPLEDKNGNLYVVGQESETIYKSADGGKSWSPISRQVNEFDFALYIDNNNEFYKSRSDDVSGGIYVSKDNGVTYPTMLYSSPNAFIENMSVQSDGNFYFVDRALGLYQATGVSTPLKRIYDNVVPGIAIPYIVAKNNNVITVNLGFNLIAYYKK
jgi:hypothetical protein